MKKIIYIFLVFGALSIKAQNQDSDVKTVLELMQKQEQSWNNGNVNGFMDYYIKSDSLMFIGSKSVTYGWQNTFNNYLKNYPDKKTMGELKFEIIKASQLSTESIFIVGKWNLTREKPVGGHFTLLWKKIDKQWLIVCDHTS